MTKEEFTKKYKDGANTTAIRFEKALYEIMTTDSIDYIMNYAGFFERRWLKKFKAEYLEVAKDWSTVPIIPLLMCIKSPLLYADVVSRVIGMDETVYRGENEDE